MASANGTSFSPPRPKIRPIPPRSGSSYESNASTKRKPDSARRSDRLGYGSPAVAAEPPSRNRKRGRSELYNDTDDEATLNTKTIRSSENGSSFSQSLTGSFRPDEDDEDGDDVMKDSIFSDVNYRRNCGSTTEESQRDELDNRGGKRRLLDVVGSVVGAVWEFCKSQAPALSLGLTSRFGPSSGAEYFDTPYNMPPEMFQDDQRQPTMPGALPEYDMFDRAAASFSPASMATLQSPTSPGGMRKHRPPALNNISSPTSSSKKHPSEQGMSGSWVLVNDKSLASVAGSSAAAAAGGRASSASTRQNQGIRPSTPMYTTSFPVMVKRNGTYSRTVPRKSRPFSRPMMPFGGANKFNPIADEIGSPVGLRASSASAPSSPVRASTARSTGASEASFRGTSKRAPLDGVYAADFVPNLPSGELRNTPSLRKNPDTDADESIRKFNKRLKDMIREGREALGSTIEVYDCEDEWDDDAPKMKSSATTTTVWR